MIRRFQKKACLFDFDGTLVNSMEELADLGAEVISETYGLSHSEARGSYVRTSGLPFYGQLEVLFPEDSRNHAASGQFEERKRERYFHHDFFQGAAEIVRYLRSRKLWTAISSSNHQRLVEEFLQAKGDLNLDLVLGWRPQFNKGRDHFLTVQKTFGITPSDLVFVGDSLHDAETSRGEGIDFIAKSGLFSADDFRGRFPEIPVIRGLEELREFL